MISCLDGLFLVRTILDYKEKKNADLNDPKHIYEAVEWAKLIIEEEGEEVVHRLDKYQKCLYNRYLKYNPKEEGIK